MEGSEAEINPQERLDESISYIEKKASEIAERHNLGTEEIYKRMGFDITQYRFDMLQILSAPYCTKASPVRKAKSLIGVIEGGSGIVECTSASAGARRRPGNAVLISEIDSSRDIVLHNLEELESEL